MGYGIKQQSEGKFTLSRTILHNLSEIRIRLDSIPIILSLSVNLGMIGVEIAIIKEVEKLF